MNNIPFNTNVQLEAVVRKFVALARVNFLSACAFAFAKSGSAYKGKEKVTDSFYYKQIIEAIHPEMKIKSYEEATTCFKAFIEEVSKNPRFHQNEFFLKNKVQLASYFTKREDIVE